MLGWTQRDLASRSGVAKRSIAGLELETSVPKPETLDRLVATLSRSGIEFRNMEADLIGVMLRIQPAPVDEQGSAIEVSKRA